MALPAELFPEAISPKQIIFILMTIGFFVVAIPLSMKYKWMDRVSLAALLYVATNPIDITLFSYTNYRGDIRGIEFGMIDWFTILLAITMTNSHHWRKHKLYFRSKNEFLMGVYLIYSFMSIGFAIVPQFAFFGFTKLIRAYAMFWVAYNYIRSEKDLKFVVYCLIGLTFNNFLQVLLDKYMRGIFPPKASFPHQNTLSTHQNMMNFIIFAFFLQETRKIIDKTSMLYGAALAAGSLTTLATLSRGGMATMVMGYGVIVVLSFLLRQKPVKQQKKRKILGLMSLLSIPVLAFVLPPILNRFETAPKESAEARHSFNDVAREMGTDHFFGIGLNNYSFAGKYMEYAEKLPGLDRGGIAHHIYWLHFAELGIIGVTAYILMSLGFILIIFNFVRKRRDSPEGIFAIGVFVSLSIFALIGTLEWLYRQIQITVMYFSFAGFALSLERVEKESIKENKNKKIKQMLLYRMYHSLNNKR